VRLEALAEVDDFTDYDDGEGASTRPAAMSARVVTRTRSLRVVPLSMKATGVWGGHPAALSRVAMETRVPMPIRITRVPGQSIR
jgi:hypothetical protein